VRKKRFPAPPNDFATAGESRPSPGLQFISSTGRNPHLGAPKAGGPDPRDNRMLAALPPNELAELAPHLEYVRLSQNQVLFDAGERIGSAYFITEGLVSLITMLRSGMGVEIALMGKEGLPGFLCVLQPTIPTRVAVQLGGAAFRISAEELRKAVRRNPTLDLLLRRFVGALWTQAAQSVACNRLHDLEQRLAKWLLLAQERSGLSLIPLTHDYLAQLLGAGRSSVSLAARALEERGLIHYTRGRIKITNRVELEKAACECYEVSRDAFQNLLESS